jgi:hypothetical protein
VKLDLKITLDGGGTVSITSDDITAEGANELFALLGGYSIESSNDDTPGPITDDMKNAFVEGFDEGRTQEENQE